MAPEDVNYFLSSGLVWLFSGKRGERIATVINFLIGIGMLDEF
jgi:hypothetical protein